MRKFKAVEFLHGDVEDWPCEALERFVCVFEDGELEVTTPRMELSSRLWNLHRHYDKLPILKDHYLGNGPIPWKRISGVLSAMYKDIYGYYNDDKIDREHVWDLIHQGVNHFYNDSVVRYKPYVRSTTSFDYDAMYSHPTMVAIRAELQPNPTTIADCHAKAAEFLMNDVSLRLNPVMSDAKTGVSNMEQLLQALVCRGYNTDIDDHIYDDPIMGNYYEGIHDPAEALLDSTLASKAMIFTGAPLEQTQYGNRKLQFSSMRIDLLIWGDCGTQHYARIEVTEDRIEGMLGLWFKDPKGKGLVEMTNSTGKQWLGTTLEVRLPIYCAHRHIRSVCSTCYGTLSRNIPYGFNLGFLASVNTQSEISQRVLKVKHVESLTFNEAILLNKEERLYVANDVSPNRLRLSPRLIKEKILLTFRGEVQDKIINGSRLPVLLAKDLNPQRAVSHMSQFKELLFDVPLENGKYDRRRLNVSKGSMSAYFTYDFLKWFVSKEFRINSLGFYQIDLEGWDFDKPFLELPKKHLSMKDFSSEVETFIRSTRITSSKHLGSLKQLDQYHDPTEATLDLFDLISTKVPVHLTHVAIVCMSFMVDPTITGTIRIPPVTKPVLFGKYSRIMSEGSFTVTTAYQSGSRELRKTQQYLNTDREQHLMDPLFVS